MSLELKHITAISAAGIRRRFHAGDVIYRQGEPGRTLLFVLSGHVTVVKDDIEIAFGGAGEFIGEMSLLENSPRFASVIAREECEAIEYDLEQFLQLTRNEPGFAVAIMRNLSRKLRESDSTRITELEENNLQLQGKNAELGRVNDFLERVINQSPAGIAIIDQNGRVELMNPAGKRLLSLQSDDSHISFCGFFDQTTPLQDFLAHNLPSWSGQYNVHAGEEKRTFFVSVSQVSAEFREARYLINFEDITELIDLNEQITKLERFATEAELASDIAHSINNYITVLSGNLELLELKLSPEGRESMKRPLTAMRSSLDEISTFVDDLMGTRDRAGAFVSKDVAESTRVLVRFITPQKRFHKIRVSLDVRPQFPRSLVVNESQIHQVLLNLLINAADALNGQESNTDKQIKVTLDRSTDRQWAVISISDNGPGVPLERKADLLAKRFTTKERGHGIGLMTVKKIIEQHSGTITFESELGHGTTFFINLPV